ncbi:MAG: hypothetical protein AB1589_25975 [Cyanobacteriota bacterium]
MSSQPMQYKNREDAVSSVQGELLEALLQPEADFYPWNPNEPEAEAYFAEIEREFLLDQWLEQEEITQASHSLFNHFHQLWNSPREVEEARLSESLSKQFSLMPQAWIEAIAYKAQQVFQTNISLADQLVQCVKPLLPNWAEDDLFVLARPLAYAMRSTCESGKELPNGIRPEDWMELSSMEQVRLSLAVAHSALVQLQHSPENQE